MELHAPFFVKLTSAILFLISIIGVIVGIAAKHGGDIFANANIGDDEELELLAEFPRWVSKLMILVSLFSLFSTAAGFWAARDPSNRRKCLTFYSMALMVLVVACTLPIMVFFGFSLRSEKNMVDDLERVAVDYAGSNKEDWVKLQNELDCCGFSMYWSIMMETYHFDNGLGRADAPTLWTGGKCELEGKNFTYYAELADAIVDKSLEIQGHRYDKQAIFSSVRVEKDNFFEAIKELDYYKKLRKHYYDGEEHDKFFCEDFIIDRIDTWVGGGFVMALFVLGALVSSLWATLRILITTQGYGTVRESEIEGLVEEDEFPKRDKDEVGPVTNSSNVSIEMT